MSIDLRSQKCYNSSMICDFHLHSTKSDGKLTPTELAQKCFARNLDCASLTDHDTVCGVAEFCAEAARLGVKVLPGIEISSFEECEIHILAYNLDYTNPDLQKELEDLQLLRRKRNFAIIEKLASLNIFIDLDEIYAAAGEKTVGRSDIAEKMISQGIVESRLQAFEDYLGFGKKAYVHAKRLTPKEAIQLAVRYGGLPVFAHPKNLKYPQHAMESLVVRLKEYGLAGIEADYYSHTELERRYYKSLADKHKLIVTGGSDFHDSTHGGESTFNPNKYTCRVLKLN